MCPSHLAPWKSRSVFIFTRELVLNNDRLSSIQQSNHCRYHHLYIIYIIYIISVLHLETHHRDLLRIAPAVHTDSKTGNRWVNTSVWHSNVSASRHPWCLSKLLNYFGLARQTQIGNLQSVQEATTLSEEGISHESYNHRLRCSPEFICTDISELWCKPHICTHLMWHKGISLSSGLKWHAYIFCASCCKSLERFNFRKNIASNLWFSNNFTHFNYFFPDLWQCDWHPSSDNKKVLMYMEINFCWISSRLRFFTKGIIPSVLFSATKLWSFTFLCFFVRTPASDRDTIVSEMVTFCSGYFLSRKTAENSYTIMIFTFSSMRDCPAIKFHGV